MSKTFVVISLFVILISACTRPVATSIPLVEEVQSAPSVPSSTPTSLLDTNISTSTPAADVSVPTAAPIIVTATTEPTCSGAPRVQIGQEVTVVVEDWDKLKLRSEPRISPDTVVMELDQLTQLEILEGPVCVSDAETQISYWFWKVTVLPTAEIGWIAEGEYPRYFIK
jgi:hypothetical protein